MSFGTTPQKTLISDIEKLRESYGEDQFMQLVYQRLGDYIKNGPPEFEKQLLDLTNNFWQRFQNNPDGLINAIKVKYNKYIANNFWEKYAVVGFGSPRSKNNKGGEKHSGNSRYSPWEKTDRQVYFEGRWRNLYVKRGTRETSVLQRRNGRNVYKKVRV